MLIQLLEFLLATHETQMVFLVLGFLLAQPCESTGRVYELMEDVSLSYAVILLSSKEINLKKEREVSWYAWTSEWTLQAGQDLSRLRCGKGKCE